MAYSTLNTTEIAAGQPTKQELFSKVKGNEDDHETRITALEAVAFGSLLPIHWEVTGDYSEYGARTGLAHFRVSSNITLNGARLLVHTVGTSGTTEIDVMYKRGVSAFATIFSTKPSVVYTAGDYTASTNAVFSVTSLQAGDILRLDITGVQSGGSISGLSVYLDFEPA